MNTTSHREGAAGATLAALYDWEHDVFDDDVQLYRQLARRTGGPVLELACGSGRVLAPLVRDGVDVVGVDASGPMLERARARLCGHEKAARLLELDITDELPEGSFGLVILALNALGFVSQPEAQCALLSRAAMRLAPGGLVAIDLVHQSLLADAGSPTPMLQRDGWCDEIHADVTKWVVQDVSFADQTFELNCMYDIVDGEGTLKRLTDRVRMRHFSRFEVQLLLSAAGLAIEGIYGDYELGPLLDNSERMIFLAMRA